MNEEKTLRIFFGDNLLLVTEEDFSEGGFIRHSDADNVSDEKAGMLSFDISQKIEKEMQYPGQIKITVIREMRSVAYAR